MIIEPPDKGWVVHVDEDIDSACSEDGTWRAPEISTEHFVLDSDTAAFAYGKHFMRRVSENPYCSCGFTDAFSLSITINDY